MQGESRAKDLGGLGSQSQEFGFYSKSILESRHLLKLAA